MRLYRECGTNIRRDDALFMAGRAFASSGDQDAGLDAWCTLIREFPESRFVRRLPRAVCR
jgi:hypothetical protein